MFAWTVVCCILAAAFPGRELALTLYAGMLFSAVLAHTAVQTRRTTLLQRPIRDISGDTDLSLWCRVRLQLAHAIHKGTISTQRGLWLSGGTLFAAGGYLGAQAASQQIRAAALNEPTSRGITLGSARSKAASIGAVALPAQALAAGHAAQNGVQVSQSHAEDLQPTSQAVKAHVSSAGTGIRDSSTSGASGIAAHTQGNAEGVPRSERSSSNVEDTHPLSLQLSHSDLEGETFGRPPSFKLESTPTRQDLEAHNGLQPLNLPRRAMASRNVPSARLQPAPSGGAGGGAASAVPDSSAFRLGAQYATDGHSPRTAMAQALVELVHVELAGRNDDSKLSAYLLILLADIRRHFLDNRFLEIMALSQAKRHSQSPWDVQFWVEQRLQVLRSSQDLDNASGTGLTPVQRLLFDQEFETATQQQKQWYRGMVEMWHELKSSTPDKYALQLTARRMALALTNCEEAFRQLMDINKNSVKVLKAYGNYLLRIRRSEAEGGALLAKAERLEATALERSQREVSHFKLLETQNDVMVADESAAVVIMSGELESLGEITEVNAVAASLLRRPKASIVGQQGASIFPPPLSSDFHQFIQGYATSGQGHLMNTTVNLFTLDAMGMIVPVRAVLRESPPLEGSSAPQFTMLMQPLHVGEHHIIFQTADTGYQITAADADSYRLMGLGLHDFAETAVPVVRFFPAINPQLAMELQLQESAAGAHGLEDRQRPQMPGADAARLMSAGRNFIQTPLANVTGNVDRVLAMVQTVQTAHSGIVHVLSWKTVHSSGGSRTLSRVSEGGITRSLGKDTTMGRMLAGRRPSTTANPRQTGILSPAAQAVSMGASSAGRPVKLHPVVSVGASGTRPSSKQAGAAAPPPTSTSTGLTSVSAPPWGPPSDPPAHARLRQSASQGELLSPGDKNTTSAHDTEVHRSASENVNPASSTGAPGAPTSPAEDGGSSSDAGSNSFGTEQASSSAARQLGLSMPTTPHSDKPALALLKNLSRSASRLPDVLEESGSPSQVRQDEDSKAVSRSTREIPMLRGRRGSVAMDIGGGEGGESDREVTTSSTVSKPPLTVDISEARTSIENDENGSVAASSVAGSQHQSYAGSSGSAGSRHSSMAKAVLNSSMSSGAQHPAVRRLQWTFMLQLSCLLAFAIVMFVLRADSVRLLALFVDGMRNAGGRLLHAQAAVAIVSSMVLANNGLDVERFERLQESLANEVLLLQRTSTSLQDQQAELANTLGSEFALPDEFVSVSDGQGGELRLQTHDVTSWMQAQLQVIQQLPPAQVRRREPVVAGLLNSSDIILERVFPDVLDGLEDKLVLWLEDQDEQDLLLVVLGLVVTVGVMGAAAMWQINTLAAHRHSVLDAIAAVPLKDVGDLGKRALLDAKNHLTLLLDADHGDNAEMEELEAIDTVVGGAEGAGGDSDLHFSESAPLLREVAQPYSNAAGSVATYSDPQLHTSSQRIATNGTFEPIPADKAARTWSRASTEHDEHVFFDDSVRGGGRNPMAASASTSLSSNARYTVQVRQGVTRVPGSSPKEAVSTVVPLRMLPSPVAMAAAQRGRHRRQRVKKRKGALRDSSCFECSALGRLMAPTIIVFAFIAGLWGDWVLTSNRLMIVSERTFFSEAFAVRAARALGRTYQAMLAIPDTGNVLGADSLIGEAVDRAVLQLSDLVGGVKQGSLTSNAVPALEETDFAFDIILQNACVVSSEIYSIDGCDSFQSGLLATAGLRGGLLRLLPPPSPASWPRGM